jgi:hypothetical protein
MEEFFGHLSLLAKDGQPDPEHVRELTQEYEIEFFPPPTG